MSFLRVPSQKWIFPGPLELGGLNQGQTLELPLEVLKGLCSGLWVEWGQIHIHILCCSLHPWLKEEESSEVPNSMNGVAKRLENHMQAKIEDTASDQTQLYNCTSKPTPYGLSTSYLVSAIYLVHYTSLCWLFLMPLGLCFPLSLEASFEVEQLSGLKWVLRCCCGLTRVHPKKICGSSNPHPSTCECDLI